MKNEKILTEILEGVNDISRRVTALEVARPVPYPTQAPNPNCWLRETYPDGFMTMDELAERVPQVMHPVDGCHQILAGMVIGDNPEGTNVIHPIVPMMFHDGHLGYAESFNGEAIRFAGVREDLPVFLGDEEQAKGMYVPFDCSKRGIDVARSVLDEMEDDIYMEEITKDIEAKREKGIKPITIVVGPSLEDKK